MNTLYYGDNLKITILTLMLSSVLFMIGPVIASGQEVRKDDTAELLELDQQWQSAVVVGDVKFIERRTADDFVFTHAGETKGDTKADWVARARRGPATFVERKVSDRSVEVHGNVALIFGHLDVKAIDKDDPIPTGCYSVQYVHLYVRRKGRWLFVSHKTTRMLEEWHACPK